MPRTGLSPAELRERAIDAAEGRIRRDGFDRVRLSDIARDLAVSHVALYKHFPDKASLLDAVTERWLEEVDARLQAIVDGPEPVGKRLRHWFLMYHRLKREKVRRDPEPYRAFDSAADAMKPSIIRHLENIDRQILRLVMEAMDAGVLRPGDSMGVARLMLESTVGFHHPKLVAERLEEDREAALQNVVETLIQGLSPR